jgi:exonuclease VII large subunit
LQRGYAVVLHDGRVVRDADGVAVGERLKILLQYGALDVAVE